MWKCLVDIIQVKEVLHNIYIRNLMKVNESKVLRRLFGRKKKKQQEDRDNYVMRSFIILHSSPIIVEVKPGRMKQAVNAARMNGRYQMFCVGADERII
jgi:hypothetical protein